MECKTSEDGRPDVQALQHVEYPCPVCNDRRFKTEQGFTDHLKNSHNIFSCLKCEAIFAAADDLARHKTEAGHTAAYKNKGKAKNKRSKSIGKARSTPQAASSPATADAIQVPEQFPPPPCGARQPTAQARQDMQVPQTTMQAPQSPTQVHPAGAAIFRPRPRGQDFERQNKPSRPRHQVSQPQYQGPQPRNAVSPPPVQAPQAPKQVYPAGSRAYDSPAQGFHPAVAVIQPGSPVSQQQVGVPKIPMGLYQAPYPIFQHPIPIIEVPGNVHQAGVYPAGCQPYQRPAQIPQTPCQIPQSPVGGFNNQLRIYRPPALVSPSPVQRSQRAEQVSTPPLQGTQPLRISQPPVQSSEQAKQVKQVSQSPIHLSTQDSTAAEGNDTDRRAPGTPATPATGTTTPSLFIPPTTTNPTFSLVYDEMKIRWTDLEPLEQSLILKYLLGRCHPLSRLNCQGYKTPKTIGTTACTNRGEPHQAHTYTRGSTHRKAIVVDCEMIETTVCTSVLGFITAIDFLTGEVLINSYVAPTAPVTNWLTPVSGITPEAMDVAITDGKAFLSNDAARQALKKFLDEDTVLIGHALQHDLRALNLLHGRIVDTSIVTAEAVFPNFSAKTTLARVWGLKTLAKELLGIDIQVGLGHNSLEDALATRELLIWCLRGPECLKAWAEKARGSYERMRLQRGEQKKATKDTKDVEKKAGGVPEPSAKAQGKKRLSK
ncbi:unnamed protein product [Penicillium egyptiacum]|uniref:C2H2-type domain-containing protein n=1 Tax=Penicillium egyptiacum TaxID=1303716 RepID=A0A9W4KC78_9EURO|nr:unnamed protein product [Penicillium egyptiacum]